MANKEGAWEDCAREYRIAEGCLKNYERIFFTSNADAMHSLAMAGDFVFQALEAPSESRAHFIQKAKESALKAQQEALFATWMGIISVTNNLQIIAKASTSMLDEKLIADFHNKYDDLQGTLVIIKKEIKRIGNNPNTTLPSIPQLKKILEKAAPLFILHETYAVDIKKILDAEKKATRRDWVIDALFFVVSSGGTALVSLWL